MCKSVWAWMTQILSQLECVLKVAKRTAVSGTCKRLPTTPMTLWQMRMVWLDSAKGKEFKLLWAAFAFWLPLEKQFDPEFHLRVGDIHVDSHEDPSMLQVVIKWSKSDLYGLGVTLYIGAIRPGSKGSLDK